MKEKQKKTNLEKEQRIQNYEMQREQMLKAGYTEFVGTISVVKANIMAMITAGPFAILVIILYFYVWKDSSIRFNGLSSFLFLLGMIVSIPIHEFIHGFTWHFFCKNKWKSIHFGIIKEMLTPYCHCKEPLSFASYLLGGLMPLLVLGFGMSILGIVLHSGLVLAIGAINIVCAGGDTTIVCMLLKYRDCKIIDHPTDCGFAAFRK
jgi:Protein of unknown function (DUF3267).